MPEIKHWEFAERPVYPVTLGFDSGTTPLNADDTVHLVLRKGTTDHAIPVTIVDRTTRAIEIDPKLSVALRVGQGSSSFIFRVTQANGDSYNHPAASVTDQWKWTIVATPATTDVAP